MSYTSFMLDIYNRLFGRKIKSMVKDQFGKDPQEVKDYWKAFRKLYTKSSDPKRVAEMEAAISACPDIWQGHFLMGLVYDTSSEKTIFDPEKASLYHMKAEQAVKGTADEKWLSSFYAWYRQDALNYRIPLEPWELAARRMGVAAMNTYQHMNPVVVARDEKDDAVFWCGIIPSYMTMPFWSYFDAWTYFKGGKGDNGIIEINSADLVKSYNKMCDKNAKLAAKLEKNKPVDDYDRRAVEDMYAYVLYHSLLNPSPFLIEEATVQRGIRALIKGADIGNAACIHELAKLAFSNKENRVFIEGIFQRMSADSDRRLDVYVLDLLLLCSDHGDAEAVRLLSEYYGK